MQVGVTGGKRGTTEGWRQGHYLEVPGWPASPCLASCVEKDNAPSVPANVIRFNFLDFNCVSLRYLSTADLNKKETHIRAAPSSKQAEQVNSGKNCDV